VARLGGDEFALARVVKSEAQAKDFVKDLSRTLQKPLLVDELLIHGGGSVGLALSSPGDIDSVSLMRDADTAMYRSKENSDITYQIFDQKFREEVTRRYTLEREIRDSVAANEFRLVYQPIVCASSKETMLLEALSRWTSPTLGTVAPPEFIPIVERLGLSIEFGRLVTAKVCQQIRRWRDEYPAMENVAVTINFSSSQLLDHGLTAFIAKTLSDHNLEGSSIVIELTESDLLQDFDRAVSVLSELRDMGIKVAIDDFGTGYSALAYLPHIPADYLKIDKAFVQNMESDESVCRLTKIIVELADRFGLKSIGEGVEKELQSESLQKFGCDFIQGYLYGKPAETNDLPAMCDWDVAAESDTDYLAQKAA